MSSLPSATLVHEIDHSERAARGRKQAATPKQRLVRFGLRAAGVAALLIGVAGVLHMPFAAPILRAISPASVCPIMRGSPEQIDRAHALAATAIRTGASTTAPSRPALGFTLDSTRKADLDAWAAAHKVTCSSIAGNDNLQRCTDVPAAAVGEAADLGPLEEVTLEFQKTGELVTVATTRRHLTADQAAHAAEVLEGNARKALGEPTTRAGEPTVAHLSHGLLATFVAVHTFTDYRATVSATNLAQTGMMVREEYLSVR